MVKPNSDMEPMELVGGISGLLRLKWYEMITHQRHGSLRRDSPHQDGLVVERDDTKFCMTVWYSQKSRGFHGFHWDISPFISPFPIFFSGFMWKTPIPEKFPHWESHWDGRTPRWRPKGAWQNSMKCNAKCECNMERPGIPRRTRVALGDW
jgi:hypothetical protein